MTTVSLSNTLKIAPVVIGTMNMMEWGLDKQELLTRVEEYIDLGLNTFDHADIYGNGRCEEFFGEILKLNPSIRDKIQIITKGGIVYDTPRRPFFGQESYNLSKNYLITACEKSLARLGIPYVDLYLFHRPCPLMDPALVAEAMAQLKKDGKVKHFGVSNFLPAQLAALEAYTDIPLITNEVKMNINCMDFLADGTMEDALRRKMPLLAYSPLCSGEMHRESINKANFETLSILREIKEELGAATIDEVMYAWLYRMPATIIPVTGSGKKERVMAAVNALKYNMSREQWYDILRIACSEQVSSKYHNL